MTKQFGVLCKTTFSCGTFAHIDNTCHASLKEAMKEARDVYQDENSSRNKKCTSVLALFEVDMETGEIGMKLSRNGLINYIESLNNADEAQREEERKYGTYEEQVRETYYTGRV